jgi:hypothetical protein
MDAAALIATAGLIGLAGSPHCAAMCAAPCAAVGAGCGRTQMRERRAGFALGRVLGYAAGGAVAAGGVAGLRVLAEAAPGLRGLWLLLQLAVLGLGLWLIATGRPPAVWRSVLPIAAARPDAQGWRRIAAPMRCGAAGSLWLLWPCGLLQSALLIAALAGTPGQGALAMASFAVTSSLGLWLPAALWQRLPAGARAAAWSWRLAGAALAAGALWALSHGVWQSLALWCGVTV